MIIKSVNVRNFRSILDETLDCDCLTALVGRNGAGKSSFLRAIELFYDPTAKVAAEDFYAEDPLQDIEIALTFSDLTTEQKDFFSAYLDNETLGVVRVFSLQTGHKSGTYHGLRLQNVDFSPVRAANGKKDARAKYEELRALEKYATLPKVGSADQALTALQKWESANPDSCVRMPDDGQFFGFTGVGQGYLGRYTRFICVPAVREASEDATEKRGSSVTEIMDLVVRSVLERRKDVTSFREQTQAKYLEIMDPLKLPELADLQQQLSGTLEQYVPDASVALRWAGLDDISIPMPNAVVKLLEDGYESSVQRTGHGLQRAFILTMLQHLVAARQAERDDEGSPSENQGSPPEEPYLPGLLLAIEEPELYQHPNRQRHLASILLSLAMGKVPGVAKNTQVIYSTHSPLFVDIQRFDQTRLLRKITAEEGKPKITNVVRTTLEQVAAELWMAKGQPQPKFDGQSLKPRLKAIMTPWLNEGFFADVVILVEGEDDRAAVLGTAAALGVSLESRGVSVLPCMSKNNLDRPLVIFRQLRIPTYVVWDSDKGKGDAERERNRYMLRLVGHEECDWPNELHDNFACFESKLEATLKEEIGAELFDRLVDESQQRLQIPKKGDAVKCPAVIEEVVLEAKKEGKTSHTLEGIVQKVIALKTMGEA